MSRHFLAFPRRGPSFLFNVPVPFLCISNFSLLDLPAPPFILSFMSLRIQVPFPCISILVPLRFPCIHLPLLCFHFRFLPLHVLACPCSLLSFPSPVYSLHCFSPNFPLFSTSLQLFLHFRTCPLHLPIISAFPIHCCFIASSFRKKTAFFSRRRPRRLNKHGNVQSFHLEGRTALSFSMFAASGGRRPEAESRSEDQRSVVKACMKPFLSDDIVMMPKHVSMQNSFPKGLWSVGSHPMTAKLAGLI